jgi:formamidopyrimidine-DNA glycosylase
MPELPEVEAARLLVEEHLVGHTLAAVRTTHADDVKMFGPSAGKDFPTLIGRKLLCAQRHGKNLWLTFAGGGSAALALHFGMTGSLAVKGVGRIQYVNAGEVDDSVWPPPFTKMEMDWMAGDGGKGGRALGNKAGALPSSPLLTLAFADPRRFGKVRLVADPRAGLPKGRDVLNDPPSVAELSTKLAKAGSKKIKPLLMDQAFLAGIGNWVADEVLWAARIHPEASAGSISDRQVAALSSSLRSVITLAVDARADDSRYPRSWIFHTRWGKTAGAMVEGHRISFIEVGGRTTAFVPGLQKKGENGGGEGGALKRVQAAAAPPVKRVKVEKAASPVKRVKVEEAAPPVKRVKVEKAVAPKKGAAAKPRAGVAKGRVVGASARLATRGRAGV